MSAIQETPKKNFYVHRGVPHPISAAAAAVQPIQPIG